MATEALEIKVGADIAAASKAFKTLQQDMKKAMEGGEKSWNDFAKTLQRGSTSVGDSAKKAGGAAKGMGKDFTGLSRVLQDLPFGLIAIQNNLTQLVPAAGVAGLAFSTLISGLTFAQVGLQNWIKGNKGASESVQEHLKKIKEVRLALEDYVESLDDINKVRIQGAQSAQEEIVKLQTLYNATQNANVPLAERRKLVDELQKEYPKYFKNISDETILAGNAVSAYNKLTTAILASARARAAQDQIVDIQKQVLVLESQFGDALRRELTAYRDYQKAIKTSNKPSAPIGFGGATSFGQGLAAMSQAQTEYNDKASETNNIWKQIVSLQDRAKKLTEDVTKNIAQNGSDVLINPSAKISDTKVKEQLEKLVKPQDLSYAKIIPQFDEKGAEKNLFGVLYGLRNKIQRVNIAPDFSLKPEVFEQIDNLILKYQGIQVLTDGFGTAFEAFGQAIINGQNAIASFGNALKGALASLMGQLIKAAGLAAIISLVTGGGGGGFMKLFKTIATGGVPKFAQGGMVSSATLAMVGEGTGTSKSNPEIIAPLDKLKDMISGIGGSQRISGEFKVKGRDLVYVIAQESQSQGRRF